MRTILVYSERANMIGISENAVLSFCAALSTDIVASRYGTSAKAVGSDVALSSCDPARFPGLYW